MNPVSTVILTLALLFGGAGAVFAFESAAQPDAATTSVAATNGTSVTSEASPASRGRHHRPRVRWAPCPAGTTLVENACVTDVVRTVTLPAPAAPVVSHGGGSAAVSLSSGDDEEHGEDDDHGDGRDGGEDD